MPCRRAESDGETFHGVRLANFAPILNSILTKGTEMLYCVTIRKLVNQRLFLA